MFRTTRSNWRSVRWRSMHDSALVQYWRAWARVSRDPATAFAVRVQEGMNARRTSGGEWGWGLGAGGPAAAIRAVTNTAASAVARTMDQGSRRPGRKLITPFRSGTEAFRFDCPDQPGRNRCSAIDRGARRQREHGHRAGLDLGQPGVDHARGEGV